MYCNDAKQNTFGEKGCTHHRLAKITGYGKVIDPKDRCDCNHK
jgi:hypothetical protein